MVTRNLKSNEHCLLPIRRRQPQFQSSLVCPETYTGKNFMFVQYGGRVVTGRFTAHQGTRLFTLGKSPLPLGEHPLLMFSFFLHGKQLV